MYRNSIASAFALALLLTSPALANDLCQQLFRENPAPTLDQMRATAEQLPNDPRVPRRAAWEAWKALTAQSQNMAEIFPESAVLPLIVREDTTAYARALAEILPRISRGLLSIGNGPEGQGAINLLLQAELNKYLLGKIPQQELQSRIQYFFGSIQRTPETLARALGDLSLTDVQNWAYGGNLQSPNPASLIGEYIQITGASYGLRTFSTQPGDAGLQGPQRLVIYVSAQSFDTYRRLFGGENFLVHVHTPRQGTLMVSHEGMAGSYASLQAPLRFPQVGTVMPHILLSTREAERVRLFFELGKYGTTTADPTLREMARYPWQLNGPQGPYAPTSGYTCCTFWIGNIPLGDNRTAQYTFAGHQEGGSLGPAPQVGELKPYTNADPLIRQVWQVPGHEQLSHVLGQAEANGRGEFANPGWVAITLTGPAPVERVPIVFVAVPDHRAPFDPNFFRSESAH